MRIDVLTLFPEFFREPLRISVLGRILARGLLEVHLHNPRDWATDRHRTVDDTPYGGGAGMVLKPDVFAAALEAVQKAAAPPGRVVFLTPQGRPFTQAVARELAALPRLLLVCGHYEGFDERLRQLYADDELSLGDFVLTGGEIPALAVIDAVARLLPGALAEGSPEEESHAEPLLEYPHYTRPAVFRGLEVPEVLRSGHHAQIARWRRQQSLLRTLQRRPDLLRRAPLSEEDLILLAEGVAEAGIDVEDPELAALVRIGRELKAQREARRRRRRRKPPPVPG